MGARLQDALRDGELDELRRDCQRLASKWAGVLLGVDSQELWMHPDREVIAARLTAAELLYAEFAALSRRLERQGYGSGLTQPELARACGVSAQAVSQRLAGVKAG